MANDRYWPRTVMIVVLFSFNLAAILDSFYFLFRLLQPYYKAMALLLSDFELCTISLLVLLKY